MNLVRLRATLDDTVIELEPRDLDPQALDANEVDPNEVDARQAGAHDLGGPSPDPTANARWDELVRPLRPLAGEEGSGRTRHEVVVEGWRFVVTVESAARAAVRERAANVDATGARAITDRIRAQLPGRIVAVFVAAGDTVAAGQRLVALEAMKMENEVRAPRAGTIARVDVKVGDRVELGDELVVVE